MSSKRNGPGQWIHARCERLDDRVVSPPDWEARITAGCPRCGEDIQLGELTVKIYHRSSKSSRPGGNQMELELEE